MRWFKFFAHHPIDIGSFDINSRQVDQSSELTRREDVVSWEGSMLHMSVCIVMYMMCMKIVFFWSSKYIDRARDFLDTRSCRERIWTSTSDRERDAESEILRFPGGTSEFFF